MEGKICLHQEGSKKCLGCYHSSVDSSAPSILSPTPGSSTKHTNELRTETVVNKNKKMPDAMNKISRAKLRYAGLQHSAWQKNNECTIRILCI